MRIYVFLGRVAKVYGAFVVIFLGVLAVLALAITVDAWMVNPSAPRGDFEIHLRYYVLPVGGGCLAAAVLWRRVIPAGHHLWLVLTGKAPGSVLAAAIRTILWFAVAVVVFAAARAIQRAMFGLFLPV